MSNDWAEEKAIDCDKFYKVDRLEAIASALREAHKKGREEGLREMQEACRIIAFQVGHNGDGVPEKWYAAARAIEDGIRALPIDGAALDAAKESK